MAKKNEHHTQFYIDRPDSGHLDFFLAQICEKNEQKLDMRRMWKRSL